ncbi:Sulfotransferase 1A4 [Armadillidium vulgare]|nr:Sulfotransferase 1A4 [Armadillidium vulgare]
MDLGGNLPPTFVTATLAQYFDISVLSVVVPISSPTCNLPYITDFSAPVTATMGDDYGFSICVDFSLCSVSPLDKYVWEISALLNPKDVVVSFYYHSLAVKVHEYNGDFDTFLDLFLKGDVLFGPYWELLEEGWERRNHPNFKLVHFEDLKKNPFEEISSLNDFLSTNLSKEVIQKIVDETSFTKMKERDLFAGNSNTQNSIINAEKGSFFRSGTAGNWKVELSDEQIAKIDEWTEKHTSNGKNFSLKYSI